MSKVIVHVDMDAFFAAVEQRDNPELRGKPVVVGADPKGGKGRGVVSTCSYEARKYGIHSALPISIAYKRCPHAVFVPPHFQAYKEASIIIRKIFYDFTDKVQPISIDEAFLDLTESYHFYKTPKSACEEIKKRIFKETELNASIGIAPVKNIAKIASDLCKPNGLLEVKEDEVLDFLRPLKVERLWGVGPKSKIVLNKLNIETVGDLMKHSKGDLYQRFGDYGTHLYNLSHGIDLRKVETDDEVKSVSHEHTFNTDTSDVDEIKNVILHISEKISRRMRKLDLKGRTLSIKVRLKGFQTYTRALSVKMSTNFADDIYQGANNLFDEFYKKGQKIRLIGVRMSSFKELYVQDSLFHDPVVEKNEEIHKAMDAIKDKFGESAIHRGV